MELPGIAILATAALASVAGLAAPALDSFRKVAAGCLALAGGVAPWLVFAAWHGLSPGPKIMGPIGFFGSSPCFLIAFFLYGMGQPTPMRGPAAAASLGGMFAGAAFTIALAGQLARME